MLKNTTSQYGTVTKAIHWLVAFIVVTLLTVGFFLHSLLETTWSTFFYTLHESMGLMALGIMIFRICWHKLNPVPKLPPEIPKLQRKIVKFSHYLLYFLLLAMPVSGWLNSLSAGYPPRFFWLFSIPIPIAKNDYLEHLSGNLHYYFAWAIIFLVVAHIFGALSHEKSILKRMTFGRKRLEV